ncbi:MAG: oligosaccharide flippase family protein [Nocardioidaceae bacterium]
MTETNVPPGTDTRRHLTQVARGGALGLVGAAASAGSGFLLVLVVTNRFPTHTAGLFFTANSAFLLLTAMSTLGAETGLGRFMLRYEAQGRHGDIPPTLRAAMRPTIGYSVVLAVLLLVFAEPVARLIGLDSGQGPTSLRILAVLVPFATWNTLALAGTRAFGRMRATVLVDQIARPVVQPLLVLLVSLVGASLLGLTFAWAIPYAVAAVTSAWLFRRFLRRRGTLLHTEPTQDYKTLRRAFWSFTWPRSITRISQMAIQRMDIILIAALMSPTDAAVYTAATRFVALGQFGTQAIQQVLQPKFTALIAHHEVESLREVYQVATGWSMAVAWPMYAVIGSAPLAYLGLFGQRYQDDGVATVLLMSLAMLFNVATGAADTLLLMSGRSGLSLFNNLAALALDIGLCLWLIPTMGITGAALAWAAASSSRCLLSVIQTRLTMGISSLGRAALIVAGANLVCIAAPVLVLSHFVQLRFWMLVLACLVLAPFYLGALWLGRRPLMLGVLRGLLRRRGSVAAEPDPRQGVDGG